MKKCVRKFIWKNVILLMIGIIKTVNKYKIIFLIKPSRLDWIRFY